MIHLFLSSLPTHIIYSTLLLSQYTCLFNFEINMLVFIEYALFILYAEELELLFHFLEKKAVWNENAVLRR